MAQRNFTIVRESTAMFDVITRMSRNDAAMALVMAQDAGHTTARPDRIRGVITKEHVAESVASTVRMYPG